MIHIPGHGLLFDGHDTPRAEVVAAARTHMIGAGMHHLEVDDLLAQPGAVVAAWWAGDEVGFCGSEHPDAKPVTVVRHT